MIYLVDKSVLARRHLDPVRQALRPRLAQLAVCPATELEVGWSARNAEHHAAIRRDLEEYASLPIDESCWQTALAWQALLVERGQHRGPGVADLIIAATARHHRATVLHYDADFDAIAQIAPDCSHEWIVTRGTVS